MRKIKSILPWMLAALVISLLLVGHSRHSSAAPLSPSTLPLPDKVHGLVSVNNNFVPAGTLVSAGCSGVNPITVDTIAYDGGTTMYVLDIPGDDPSTTGNKEGCSSGETIIFKIANDVADQTKNWSAGGFSQLDLSVNNLLSIYLPFVMR